MLSSPLRWRNSNPRRILSSIMVIWWTLNMTRSADHALRKRAINAASGKLVSPLPTSRWLRNQHAVATCHFYSAFVGRLHRESVAHMSLIRSGALRCCSGTFPKLFVVQPPRFRVQDRVQAEKNRKASSKGQVESASASKRQSCADARIFAGQE